jgi:hypothetical protein
LAGIELKESISDSDSAFNIKRFRIASLSFEGPIRTVDSRHTIKRSLEREVPNLDQVLIETSKTVAADAVRSVVGSTDPTMLKRHFGYAGWHSDYENTVNLTFKFNPISEFEDLVNITGYFDHYYQYSGTMLMVPNIKLSRNIYQEGKKVGVMPIIDSDDFRRYVSEVHDFLNYRNRKPIFVPLNLNFDIKDTEELADFFIKNEFTNVWVDFEASSTADKRKAALLRSFIRRFDQAERFDELILYMTNIKREILAHPKDAQSPSSDVLGAVMGANIIGVNRDPQMMFPKDAPPPPSPPAGEMLAHKARLLDTSSYYYSRLDTLDLDEERRRRLYNKKENILSNTVLLNQELKEQTREFLEELSIKPYISSKPMVREYKDGMLMDHLFTVEAKGPTEDWF